MPARHPQGHRNNKLDNLPYKINERYRPEMHGPLQQAQMNVAQAPNHNRKGHPLSYPQDGGIIKEMRQQVTGAGKYHRKDRADAKIAPKQIARERIRKFLALHYEFRQSS
jgi:hypothetical protein